MRRLILTRHAKSDWSDEDLTDHDRQLNERGRGDAPRLGQWLVAQGYLPEVTLCSTATRARQTRDAMSDLPGPIEPQRALYLASAGQMLTALRQADGEVVMMVGHNPGIADFAETLLAQPADHPRFHSYPTCATLVADFPVDSWQDLRRGTGVVQAFVVPADVRDI
ncbi:MAG: histidine phosphatase family protein [Celeribacter sp.]|jgi:phosphohistidine phosphatase